VGQILFHFFIKDLFPGTDCTLSKFTGDTKLGRVPATPPGCAAILTDLGRLQDWAEGTLMKFNKGKRKVHHLGRNEPRHGYTPGADELESSSADKDPGVLGDDKLTTMQQCALHSKGGPEHPVLHLAKHCLRVEGGDPSPLLQHW